jgi:signal transduction histidine kinase
VAILATAYATGRTVARTITVVTALVAAALFAGVAAAVAGSWWTGLAPMAVAAIPVGAAVGDAVRSSRDLVVALEDRARRRVADERLHIARDVHDLVAHHIAIVNVQAGVASHLLHDRPEAAEEALGHVTGASKAALDELGTLLGVLRGSGELATPTEPTPGLADLEGLVASVAGTGLHVDRAVVGSPRPLPPAVDVSAYRIVQEALTNARKYGTGRAQLNLTYTPGYLEIEVRNASAGSPSSRAGHGLIGMRERAMAVGGEMTAGPVPGGEFAVRVRVPVPEEEAR